MAWPLAALTFSRLCIALATAIRKLRDFRLVAGKIRRLLAIGAGLGQLPRRQVLASPRDQRRHQPTHQSLAAAVRAEVACRANSNASSSRPSEQAAFALFESKGSARFQFPT